ncbi:response regulator transcription factor [Fulvivirgaceae bacterium BMA12]|uniref:Response regulator transcription factor n=1 Tax=Agaribacillus aureus TaxID=3051825 RepID=A0ABT8LEJ1_9BACT|nr:response regulator transcription factor [Fulvivirgaceae bacterium BMA12]
MKVLVVEDDANQAARLVRHIKRLLGDDILIAGPYEDFKKVLPHIKQKDISFALIDIQLHDNVYAGINVAEMIQEFLSIPILFISGITDAKVLEKADQVNYSDFLQKPYDFPSLERAISRILNNKYRRRNTVKIAFQPRGRDKYWIKTDRSEYHCVSQQDILCIEAMDHYCRIYVDGHAQPLMVKASLKGDIMEYGLATNSHFFRLSRSLVINLEKVEKVEGNVVHIRGLQLTRNRNVVIPKDKRKVVFQALGIPY